MGCDDRCDYISIEHRIPVVSYDYIGGVDGGCGIDSPSCRFTASVVMTVARSSLVAVQAMGTGNARPWGNCLKNIRTRICPV